MRSTLTAVLTFAALCAAAPAFAQSTSTMVRAAGLTLTPFSGGCFADPSRYGSMSYGALSLVAGDCPADGGYYNTPFQLSTLSGHISAGTGVDSEYRSLGGSGDQLVTLSWFQSRMGHPRPSVAVFERISGRVMRIVVVSGPQGNDTHETLTSVAKDWIRSLQGGNYSSSY